MPSKKYIFDFDSTLTQVEAFEELAEISLANRPDKDAIIKQIADITDQGVDGTITFTESVTKRIDLLDAREEHLAVLVENLKGKISKSIAKNKAFFEQYANCIYVVSCGFKEFINPIVAEYHITPDRVFANTFKFDGSGKIIGFDAANPLSKPSGKIEQLKQMNLEGELIVIGDGYSDYEMKGAGIAHKFYAYTENIARKNILDIADHITPSFDEFLYHNKLPMSVSYPKNRIKVLLLENIHEDAFNNLKAEGYQVELLAHSLDEDELIEKMKDVHLVGLRSKTQITRKVIENSPSLKAIGAFCIGTNQIDLSAALEHGIAVFNAPYSNTRSVVELAIAEMIMLIRNAYQNSVNMHKGVWNKSAVGSYEIRNKTLGIIGYGKIGSQLSVVAESLGMQVQYYDKVERLALGNATKCRTLEELLQTSDVVTLHIDGNPENDNFFGANEFELMKEGSIFLNLARGFVVDIDALAANMKSGKIRGAAVDVFPEEPSSNKEPFYSKLQGLDNIILTPHVGGSTQEAQKNIAEYVPERFIEYLNTGNTFGSVNFPEVTLPELKKGHRLLHIHKNVPGILAKINNILAKYEINILGQYLKTAENVGYSITDIDKSYDDDVIKELKQIDNTIKFRILY